MTIQTIDALPANILNRVVAVTMFGAPACPAKVQGKCISYCQAVCDLNLSHANAKIRQGDTICANNRKRDIEAQNEGLERRQLDCARLLALPTSGLGTGGHLGYNADGTYVRAAACYIQSKFGGA